ncbi:MAG TPA: DNA primase, partial [Gemmatimonadaceae bacterium]|nr:DNA primase [Gemmatimonadaceae bacterium]
HGKNPNFSVTDAGYKCFKCGESGDVFSFVQKHLGLDFAESVKWVGNTVGIEVRDIARRTEERDLREPLWEVNATAADFFRTQLWDAPAGKVARDYLASRGISREDADRFGLGYAPKDPAAMREALATLGFDDARQLAAKVLVVHEDRPEPRPRFRDRLIFPIYDVTGHTAGFGGRILGSGEPKYLNSSESEAFPKGKLLYGLNWAKQAIRKADRLVVVEGYFDAIRLMLAGINECVAGMGTALTPQQAALIGKYTKNVFLLYDSDPAGLKATFKAGNEFLSNGIRVFVISLPEGEDPDTFVAKHGAEGFERAAAESVDVFDRKIQILERGGWFADLRRKRQAIDKLLPTIRVTSDRVLRDMYITRTSEVAGVSRDELLRELNAKSNERRASPEVHHHGSPPASEPDGPPEFDDPGIVVRAQDRRADRGARGVRAERELIRLLLHQRRYVEAAAERIGADMFLDGAYRRIFAELTAGEPDVSVDVLAAALDEETTGVLQELMNETGGLDRPDEAVNASLNALLAREIAQRLGELDRLLPLADAGDKDELLREKTRLAIEIKTLGRPRWKSFDSTRSRS